MCTVIACNAEEHTKSRNVAEKRIREKTDTEQVYIDYKDSELLRWPCVGEQNVMLGIIQKCSFFPNC